MWYRSVAEIAEDVRWYELNGDRVAQVDVDDLRALLNAIPSQRDLDLLQECIVSAKHSLKTSNSYAASSALDYLEDALDVLTHMRKRVR